MDLLTTYVILIMMERLVQMSRHISMITSMEMTKAQVDTRVEDMVCIYLIMKFHMWFCMYSYSLLLPLEPYFHRIEVEKKRI